MGQDYALTRRNMINQVHSLQPQPVIEFISYRLEVIGSTGGAAFITPRSAVRSRPPLPISHTISRAYSSKQSRIPRPCRGKMGQRFFSNDQIQLNHLTSFSCNDKQNRHFRFGQESSGPTSPQFHSHGRRFEAAIDLNRLSGLRGDQIDLGNAYPKVNVAKGGDE